MCRGKSKSGQATIEYILLLTVVVFLTSLVSKGLQGTWQKGISGLGGSLERALKTGRLPVHAWKVDN